MSMTIELSTNIEQLVRDRAARDGKRPEDLVRQLVETEFTTPTLEQDLSRFRTAVLNRGETEEESAEYFQSVVDDVRAERVAPGK